MIGGVSWNNEYLPLCCLPTMDWTAAVNGKHKLLQLTENRIGVEDLLAKDNTIVLKTKLSLTDEGAANLKPVCANPIKAYLDGKKIIGCGARTIVIPAYYRADERKCADLPEGTGAYELRVEIDNAESFDAFYFYVVPPNPYFAHRLDSVYRA